MSNCIQVINRVVLFTIHYFACAVTYAWSALWSFGPTGQLCCYPRFHYFASVSSHCCPVGFHWYYCLLPVLAKQRKCLHSSQSSPRVTNTSPSCPRPPCTYFLISLSCSSGEVTAVIIEVTELNINTSVIMRGAFLLLRQSDGDNNMICTRHINRDLRSYATLFFLWLNYRDDICRTGAFSLFFISADIIKSQKNAHNVLFIFYISFRRHFCWVYFKWNLVDDIVSIWNPYWTTLQLDWLDAYWLICQLFIRFLD